MLNVKNFLKKKENQNFMIRIVANYKLERKVSKLQKITFTVFFLPQTLQGNNSGESNDDG